MSDAYATALSLLNALLPSEGYRCGVWIKEKKVQQAFFQTNEELALALVGTNDGWDTYHACAVYNSSTRQSTAASSTRAFWVDVDCGAGKPYRDFSECVRALAEFTRRASIGEPTVVASGYGLHAYWFLTEAIDPQTWKRYAEGLKAACVTHGFHTGPERTADIVSILRTPGTHNYKRGGKVPVVLGPLRGPYDLRNFHHLLDQPGTYRTPRDSDHPHLHGPRRLGSVAAAAANIYQDTLADADAIADKCNQIGICRATRGQVSEPVWKAMMGVLAHCEDGEEIAHEWSQGDPRYDESETQGKFERSVAHGAPTTCGHFNSINGDGCRGCVFSGRIATPLQLGREPASAGGADRPVDPVHPGTVEAGDLGHKMPLLPPDFSWGQQYQLLLRLADKNTTDAPIIIAQNPVYLVSVARGEINRDCFSYVIRHKIPSEGWQDIELPASVLFSSQGGSALAGKGVVVENADGFRKFIRDSHNMFVKEKKLVAMYEQNGWKEDDKAFLVGNRMYRADSIDTVPGNAEMNYRATLFGPREGGSLDTWKDRVAKLFRPGTEAATFAMLAGFGAPLIRFLSTTEGGAVVSIISRESGKGKSVGIDGATSIWGSGEALRLINFDTQVARAITWGVLGNLPCVLDDVAHRDAEQARDFIQRFTDGRDKLRGTREGAIRHLLASWQTILITSSNQSLVDQIGSIGGTMAMAFRVLEFEATLPDDVDKRNGEKWRRELLLNWGFAGDEYMRYLLTPEVLAWTKNEVPKKQEEIIEQHGFSTEHRFWTRTIACVHVAHALVHRLGLVDFPPGIISEWAIDSAKVAGSIGKDKAAGGSLGGDSAAEVLSAFLSESIDHTLTLTAKPKEGHMAIVHAPLPRGRINIRHEIREHKLYVREDVLKKYCVKRNFSWVWFRREMEARRAMFEVLENRSLTQGTDLVGGTCKIVGFNTEHPEIAGALPTLKVVGDDAAA